MSGRGWTISDLARKTGVHQSQISRIATGNFKTFASNVIKICMELGMEPTSYYMPIKADEDRKAIVDSAIAIWDGTHRDTGVVVSLIKEIAKLRKHGWRG